MVHVSKCKRKLIKDKIYKVNAIIINNLIIKAYVIGHDQNIIIYS